MRIWHLNCQLGWGEGSPARENPMRQQEAQRGELCGVGRKRDKTQEPPKVSPPTSVICLSPSLYPLKHLHNSQVVSLFSCFCCCLHWNISPVRAGTCALHCLPGAWHLVSSQCLLSDCRSCPGEAAVEMQRWTGEAT